MSDRRGKFETFAYGKDPAAQGDLYLPERDRPAVVCLLHGGFWRMPYGRDQLAAHAVDLARRGYAAWNLGYRRLGVAGAGWPGTFDDVSAGIDFLRSLQTRGITLDLDRVAVIGHSAGGHLALWAAGQQAQRRRQALDCRVAIAAVCALAPVADLELACALGLSDNVTERLLGGLPANVPHVYAQASPIRLLPFGIPQLVVHGEMDDVVPIGMTRNYVQRAGQSGDHVDAALLPSSGHFEHLDAQSEPWAIVTAWLDRVMG